MNTTGGRSPVESPRIDCIKCSDQVLHTAVKTVPTEFLAFQNGDTRYSERLFRSVVSVTQLNQSTKFV